MMAAAASTRRSTSVISARSMAVDRRPHVHSTRTARSSPAANGCSRPGGASSRRSPTIETSGRGSYRWGHRDRRRPLGVLDRTGARRSGHLDGEDRRRQGFRVARLRGHAVHPEPPGHRRGRWLSPDPPIGWLGEANGGARRLGGAAGVARELGSGRRGLGGASAEALGGVRGSGGRARRAEMPLVSAGRAGCRQAAAGSARRRLSALM
jgi:hypothetical protein